MNVAEYLISRVVGLGIDTVFMVPGGGSMFINDAINQHDRLKFVCNLHEQASAVAAEAYAKVHGIGCCVVTSGPGATNAITGLVGAWQDSTPVLFLSGQVKTSDFADEIGVRSRGSQEVNITEMVRSCSKYATRITEPSNVRLELEKAIHLAMSGRRGPVWIDVPLDIQSAEINPSELIGYEPPATEIHDQSLNDYVESLLADLEKSERPVLLLGYGIRSAGRAEMVSTFVEKVGIPTLLTWMSLDFLYDTHPLLIGKPGVVASRAANFAVECADLVIAIGARLDNSVTAFSPNSFAPNAKKYVIDIDPNELKRFTNSKFSKLCIDAGMFIDLLQKQLPESDPFRFKVWAARCQSWKARFPVVTDDHLEQNPISVYALSEAIAQSLSDTDLIVSGSSGSAVEIFLHSFRFTRGKRVIHTASLGSMGFALPSIIGASCASPDSQIVSVDGDGGFFFNVQELETIRRLGIKFKLFVINNDGFSSIRNSQSQWFNGRVIAADRNSGLTLPSIEKVVRSYDLEYVKIDSHKRLADQVSRLMRSDESLVCEVITLANEKREPRVPASSSRDGVIVSARMSEMEPHLDVQVLAKELNI